MLVHPQFDPVAISVFGLPIRWYALSYLVGFLLAWLLARYRIKQGHTFFNAKMLEDTLFACILGVILGGRLGYILFYQFDFYWANPIEIIKLNQGGMSFHGGLLGVLVALWYCAWRNQRRFMEFADFAAPLVPLGLASGRLGNFMNQELWGRATDVPWAMIFPAAHDNIARHPSQLYQAGLEGLLLFVVVWWFSRRPRPIGQVGGVFMLGYGICRFIAEYFREPDSYLGYLMGHLSMGQWLSLPMILIGIVVILWSRSQAVSIISTPEATQTKDAEHTRAKSKPNKKRRK